MSQIWVARILQVTLTYWKLDGFWWRLPPAVILHIREVQTPSQSDPELSDTQPLDLQLLFEINVPSAWIIMLNVHAQSYHMISWARLWIGKEGRGWYFEVHVAVGVSHGVVRRGYPLFDVSHSRISGVPGNVQNKEELFVNCSKHFLITC